VKIVLSDGCASTLQVISKIEHRDKKTTNALLAKTVEICAAKHIPYLQYGVWSSGTLGDFKIYNGFEKMCVPKYFIPISAKGYAIMKLQLHHGIKGLISENMMQRLIALRTKWYKKKLPQTKKNV
jgi:hypothetical protein